MSDRCSLAALDMFDVLAKSHSPSPEALNFKPQKPGTFRNTVLIIRILLSRALHQGPLFSETPET